MLTIKLSQARPAETDAQGNITKNAVKGGTVCVYGLTSKFPVALYANQWEALLAVSGDILAFIKAQRAAGNITDREEIATVGDRVVLKATNPLIAALMAAKSIDATEAERQLKASGMLK